MSRKVRSPEAKPASSLRVVSPVLRSTAHLDDIYRQLATEEGFANLISNRIADLPAFVHYEPFAGLPKCLEGSGQKEVSCC